MGVIIHPNCYDCENLEIESTNMSSCGGYTLYKCKIHKSLEIGNPYGLVCKEIDKKEGRKDDE